MHGTNVVFCIVFYFRRTGEGWKRQTGLLGQTCFCYANYSMCIDHIWFQPFVPTSYQCVTIFII